MDRIKGQFPTDPGAFVPSREERISTPTIVYCKAELNDKETHNFYLDTATIKAALSFYVENKVGGFGGMANAVRAFDSINDLDETMKASQKK